MEKELKYTIIKSLPQYTEYCNIHESLMTKDDTKFKDEIELLELLIEDYDQRIMHTKAEELNPVELLRSLIRDGSITQSELAKSIQVSKQLISDVLGYRRNISKDLMIKLSSYFSMSLAAFSREYDLISNREDLEAKNKLLGHTS
ncbi:helix-turn-helix domain-containing protein [Flavilitoribacter nigricans]|uniref:Transcriptional regulator n=1 Tax=Flavilitoribacter nigricans (strain ATCC 23147 / DSM 23189 / NBRC 102662 / NCIMB 1420 / SS-2) TaxID=1122177 RepID=A0A2D0N582_FLAN2|nr:helix-turn-helix domain-containing protein [Flavilitoribacter nigricans]PHN03597.1 transcriptional regulator [Flavilitoribacter nigricans DSM 23189 = NBRC 102662]